MGKKKTILVTGGCGFIGTNLIRKLLNDKNNYIVNIDDKQNYDLKLKEIYNHHLKKTF